MEVLAGGEFILQPGSAFNLASGRTLLTQASGSKLTFNRGFGTSAGTTLSAGIGADIVGSSFIDVGNGAAGTLSLSLDDSGTTLTTAGGTASDWGEGNAGSFTGTIGNSAAANVQALRIGTSNGTASLSLTTSGSLTAAGSVNMGGGTSARNVSMTINGGSFTANGNATFDNRAVVNLQGGSLTFAADAQFNAGSTLNRTGGTLTTIGVGLTFNGGVHNRNAVGTELSNASALRLTAGGQSTGTSFFDIANFNTTGTLSVDGAGSLITAGGGAISAGAATPAIPRPSRCPTPAKPTSTDCRSARTTPQRTCRSRAAQRSAPPAPCFWAAARQPARSPSTSPAALSPPPG